jgi:hypothetical protein
LLALVLGLFVARTWAESGALIPVGATWRHFPLTVGPAPVGWERAGFDDAGWSVGKAGFSAGLYGYDQAATALPSHALGNMVRGVLLRNSFVVRDAATVETLGLRVDYEDGLVGWLNGEEVFRKGLPPGGAVNGLEVPSTRFAGTVDWIDLTPFRNRLVPGTNVFALMVLDATSFGGSLLAWPELRANFLRGPLVQNVSSNTATVFWKTAFPVEPRLRYGVAGAEEPPMEVRVGWGTNGAVVLNGLKSGTEYDYWVEWDGATGRVTSEPARFTTFRESGDVEFLVVGDSGSGSLAQHAVSAAMARERVDLVLHTGDISYPVFEDGQIDLRCFGAYEPHMRGVPYYFTVGNHDFYNGDQAYLEAFWLPTNSVTGTEHYYSFDHGDAHFVSLFVPWHGVSQFGTVLPDGSRSAPYRWLTNDLAGTRKPWKVVFFHQPIRTSGPHILDDYEVSGRSDIEELREALLPALASSGVQVVFMGHDHAWERFAPTNGVHAVVTGGGGAVLYPMYRRDGGSAQFVYAHHFVRARLRGEVMHLEAVSPEGRILDQFSVRRAGSMGEVMPLRSEWGLLEAGVSADRNEDGNRPGETFDLTGEGFVGMTGEASNPGRLVVNHDTQRVRVGLRDAMLWPGQTLLLFLGTAESGGWTNCLGVGSLRGHPLAGLNLGFEGFRPLWVGLLGDEWADGNLPEFRRLGDSVALGQGLFSMTAAMEPVDGIRLRQFNRSPEVAPVPGEENADFMVIDFARSMLGLERVGASLSVGAVVVTPVVSGNAIRLELDTAFLGGGLRRAEDGAWKLESLEVSLAAAPAVDRDGDGLDEGREAELETDPDHPDTDRDGLPDGWEVEHRLNPKSGVGEDGADGDPDQDGSGNAEEFRLGTSPREAGPLRLEYQRDGGRLRLEWRTVVGRQYDVEVVDGWPGRFESAQLPGFPRRASGNRETTVVEPGPMGQGPRWYRVRETGRE